MGFLATSIPTLQFKNPTGTVSGTKCEVIETKCEKKSINEWYSNDRFRKGSLGHNFSLLSLSACVESVRGIFGQHRATMMYDVLSV